VWALKIFGTCLERVDSGAQGWNSQKFIVGTARRNLALDLLEQIERFPFFFAHDSSLAGWSQIEIDVRVSADGPILLDGAPRSIALRDAQSQPVTPSSIPNDSNRSHIGMNHARIGFADA
jgi:hypothetical protein